MHIVEEVPDVAWEGAPVLRWRFDCRAQLSGRHPSPVRVVKKDPADSDQVRVPLRNDGLNLVRFVDEADGDGWNINLVSDFLGKRHLIAHR